MQTNKHICNATRCNVLYVGSLLSPSWRFAANMTRIMLAVSCRRAVTVNYNLHAMHCIVLYVIFPSSNWCVAINISQLRCCAFPAAGVHSINYLLQGPAASFPSLLASDAALAAMQAAVYGSLGLTPAYPLSSIQVNLLKTLGTARAAAQPAGTLDSSIAAAAAAAVQPATGRRAIFKAAIADQPKGQLPPNIGFLLIASPALLVPTLPFGPGLTAQACDEDGNILNPIGETRA